MLGNLFKARSKVSETPVEDKTDKSTLSRRMRGVLVRDHAEKPDAKSPALAPDAIAPLESTGEQDASAERIEQAAEAVHFEADALSAGGQANPSHEMPSAKPMAGSLREIRAEIEARLGALRAARDAVSDPHDDDADPEPMAAIAGADTITAFDPAGDGENDDTSSVTYEEAQPVEDVRQVDEGEAEASVMEPADDMGEEEPAAVASILPADHSETVQPITMVYLSREAMDDDDPARANELSAEVVNYLLFEAGYRSDEIAREAFCAWCVNRYHGEVSSGGLTQFIHNATGYADLWEGCRDGLEMIGAPRHLAVFDRMTRMLADNAGLAEALAEAGSDDAVTSAIANVDQAFADANGEETLAELTGAWLRNLSNLAILDAETLQEEVTALADRPGLAERRARMADED